MQFLIVVPFGSATGVPPVNGHGQDGRATPDDTTRLLQFLTSGEGIPYYGDSCDRSRLLLETLGGVAQW